MEKKHFLHLFLALGLVVLVISACSKDDGCETQTYYLDADNDTYGDSSETETACKKPVGNYVLRGGDTNDDDANVNPDCTNVFYKDSDNDGEGDPNQSITVCEAPENENYVTNALDPNDADDSITSNCAEADRKKFYVDADDDGFGVESEFILACTEPTEGNYTTQDSAFDCNDDDENINPDAQVTYYLDSDEDTYGDPNMTEIVSSCDPAPEGNYVLNGDDCDDGNKNAYPGAPDITYYLDADDDGYGNSSESDIRSACDPVPNFNYALEGGDCNDQDDTIYPGADDAPNDGVDSDCDGTAETAIWTGPDLQFNSAGSPNWATDAQYWDQITENVALVRAKTEAGHITNIQWWIDLMAIPTYADIVWEYDESLSPVADVGNENPYGGPHGLRWAILEQGGNTQSWDDFNLYGTLGDPTHFYSLNNIVTICEILDDNLSFDGIVDDLEVASSDYEKGFVVNVPSLVGKSLAVWIAEEDIYFTITFSDLSQSGDRPMVYTRSTPNN
ncbi:putative metal-binding motif-containing protein [Flagellimonas sp.]|uniref:putative metal-binding motif-containing protein n=1 Tax=Flagellimonas sp. TaxID=2058762 RepID=UPI003B504045